MGENHRKNGDCGFLGVLGILWAKIGEYVEGYQGFPYLKYKKKVSWFLVLVSGFQNCFMFSKDILYALPNSHLMILKILLDGTLSIFGARLFEKCQHVGFPQFRHLLKNEMFQGFFLILFRYPSVSKDKTIGFGGLDTSKNSETIEMRVFGPSSPISKSKNC